MKITKLTAENFKRLTAVNISPDGGAVVIGGRNGQGKSSALDAIEAALGGADHSPEEPIKKGQKKARVVVETTDHIVTRTFTPKGSQLEVKAKDGSTFTSPQKLLDGLVGPLSFDPLAFARLPPKEQAATLRQLVGLDFGKEDLERENAYNQRTAVARERKRLAGALDKMALVPTATPDAEVSVDDLNEALERRIQANRSRAREVARLEAMRAEAARLARVIADLTEKIGATKAELEQLNRDGLALREAIAATPEQDEDGARQALMDAAKVNNAVRAKLDRARLQAEHDTAEKEEERLSHYIAQIDGVKAEAAASARYPIPGLAIGDAGVTLNGVPLEQASSAEKLRASVAIGLALNPKLKVLLIRDGSLLDAESLALVAQMATAADAQVWIERVSKGSEVTVVIEDGEVVEDRTERTDGRQPATGVA